MHSWIVFIGKQWLPHLYPVTGPDQHGGLHACIVKTHQRHTTWGSRFGYGLPGLFGNRKIHARIQLDHSPRSDEERLYGCSLAGRPPVARIIGNTPAQHQIEGLPTAILIMATVNHFMLSQLSKLARLEAEMSRNIDFYALLALEMAGITFVAFDQQP